MKIICYGDSNTWGYDPRDPFGGQVDMPWCSVLQELSGYPVVNFGENGCTVPAQEWEYRFLGRTLMRHPDAALLLVMLGTNDLLQGKPPAEICGRLEDMVHFLKQDFPALTVILLTPPQIDIPKYRVASDKLADEMQLLAKRLFLPFCNCGMLPLAFDGVHLSEDGHSRMGQVVFRFLSENQLLRYSP